MNKKDRNGSIKPRRPPSPSAPEHIPAGLDYPRAMQFAQLVMDRVREELENWEGSAAAKRELRKQADMFRMAFGRLGQQLTPIWRALNAEQRRELELAIVAFASSALSIGEYVPISPIRQQLDAINQAKAARKARAQAPAEKALMRAIVTARGRRPAQQAWKEAESIESQVNESLVAAGHKRVSVYVIHRRLKAFDPGRRPKQLRS
jgi:hypothetical protein